MAIQQRVVQPPKSVVNEVAGLPGFEIASDDITYRLLIASQGRDKSGKTEFGFTAPSPIAVISMDIGLEGVVEKWVKRGKKIWVAHFNVPPVVNQSEYLGVFNRTRDAYYKAISHKDVRTVLVDTGTDWWELARLAEFGQLSPAADIKRAYAPLNQLFRSLLKMGFDTNKSIIITHKMKENWTIKQLANGKVQDVADGTYSRAGFSESEYLVQANIEHRYNRDTGKFEIEILNCRQNMNMTGMTLIGDECTFANVGSLIFEGTSVQDWQ